jgi:protein-disulfide isomerase
MMKALFLAAAAGMLAIGPAAAQQDLSRPGSAFGMADNPGNWHTTIARTDRGHLIGNPEADTRLIEFVSYTCGHCADFTIEGEPALELALLKPGKGSVEVRPIIRNPLDLTVTLLAQCSDPAQFKTRHQTLMRAQSDWLAKARGAPESQRAIWMRGDKAGRMNAASALGLTEMLVRQGQSRAELDACVMDDAAAGRVTANDRADRAEFAVPGTPSFALDGKLLPEVHSWDALYAVLSARFTEGPVASAAAPG